MPRLLVALAVLIVIVGVGGGAYIWSRGGFDRPFATTSSAAPSGVTATNPFGTSRDPNDPGEQHYIHGRYPEAIALWRAEAARGNTQAAHRLGVEYMDGKRWVVGEGCAAPRCPDYSQAMQYHRQAALGGNALSMFDMGSLYEYGLGVEKNLVEAARWYGHAARYGLAQGQYNYATMLEAGEGLAKDEIEAYKFFVLAARNGFTGVPYDNQRFLIDKNAPTPVELLQRKLTMAQLREGQERADAFQPTSGPLAPG